MRNGSYDLDPAKCKELSDRLSDQILKAHASWEGPYVMSDELKEANRKAKEEAKR